MSYKWTYSANGIAFCCKCKKPCEVDREYINFNNLHENKSKCCGKPINVANRMVYQ